MKENDEFILDIKRLGINGEGIGFYNKLAVFVEDAIPGEGHNVKITKCEPKMAYAKSLEIKHKSEDRIEPLCKHYYECGGCQVMHIRYQKMLEFKRESIIEAFNRYTKINPKTFEIKTTIPSKLELGYRNRSILPVNRGIDGKLHICMIKANTNYLTPIDDCPVQDKLINELNEKIIGIANSLNITPYIHKYNRGILRYVSIRVNRNNEALVTLICGEKSPKIKDLAEKISKLDNVAGVYENFNLDKKSINPFGEETNHLFGKEFIIETLGNIKYKIYPTTFFQLNTNQAEVLVENVKKLAKLSAKETVLDAYCGVGAIGLYLAKNSKEIIGIESNNEAVIAAKENAKMNKIDNASFYCGDASNIITDMIKKGKIFDVVVVDPPRTGLDEKLLNSLYESNIKKIIYVSCNPSTLAKNIDKLSGKYKINQIIPLDLFPYTSHCESISLLTRKN